MSDALTRLRAWIPLLVTVGVGASLGNLPAGAQGPIFETETPRILRITQEGERQVLTEDWIGEFELQLFQRFRRLDPPDEVFMLRKDDGYSGATWDFLEIIVRGDQAELRLGVGLDQDRYFYRKLTTEQLAALHRFVREKRVDQWRNFTYPGLADGTIYHYYHVTKDGVRWITIQNPPDRRESSEFMPRVTDGTIGVQYGDFVNLLRDLADPDTMEARYLLSRRFPELRVLYAQPRNPVYDVWARGEDIRVLVRVAESSPRTWEWRALVDGRIGDVVQTPEGHTLPEPPQRMSGLGFGQPEPNVDPDNPFVKDELQAAEENLKRESRMFVISPDGHWGFGVLEFGDVTCLDRRNGTTTRIESPEGRNYTDVAYIPSLNKAMLAHAAASSDLFVLPMIGPLAAQGQELAYELLDPLTGEKTELKMYDNPWFERRQRYNTEPVQQPLLLQPSGQDHVVWALRRPGPAKYFDTDHFYIGRYDTREFKFVEGFFVPSLVFCNGKRFHTFSGDSGDLWVDETARKVYFIERGHLLCWPMPECKPVPDLPDLPDLDNYWNPLFDGEDSERVRD